MGHLSAPGFGDAVPVAVVVIVFPSVWFKDSKASETFVHCLSPPSTICSALTPIDPTRGPVCGSNSSLCPAAALVAFLVGVTAPSSLPPIDAEPSAAESSAICLLRLLFNLARSSALPTPSSCKAPSSWMHSSSMAPSTHSLRNDSTCGLSFAAARKSQTSSTVQSATNLVPFGIVPLGIGTVGWDQPTSSTVPLSRAVNEQCPQRRLQEARL